MSSATTNTGAKMMTNCYFLGVDVGATKSHALIADETGRALGLGIGGPGNYETVGYTGLERTLKAIVDEALSTAKLSEARLSGAGFGIAGYDWPAEFEPTRRAIQKLGLPAPFTLVNDTIIGLLAGAEQGWGIAVVAGTSCNCWGRDPQGREGHVTGEGPRMGEYGGAGEIVEEAVRAVSRAWSKRGPVTALTQAFISLTGATGATDLLEGLTLGRYELSAANAVTVFQVASEGDAVAEEVIKWAGRELGSLAVGVIRQLALEQASFEVVLVGSTFKGSPLLIETMSAAIHAVAPAARLVRLPAPPVIGGVLLGMGTAADQVRRTLIATTNNLLAARSSAS
jgi:N-acetylglucosamine kinase-like BadF-type ATPase